MDPGGLGGRPGAGTEGRARQRLGTPAPAQSLAGLQAGRVSTAIFISPKRQSTFPQISTREFLGESAGRPRRSPPPAGVRAGNVGRRGASGEGPVRGGRARARARPTRRPQRQHARRPLQGRPFTHEGGRVPHVRPRGPPHGWTPSRGFGTGPAACTEACANWPKSAGSAPRRLATRSTPSPWPSRTDWPPPRPGSLRR